LYSAVPRVSWRSVYLIPFYGQDRKVQVNRFLLEKQRHFPAGCGKASAQRVPRKIKWAGEIYLFASSAAAFTYASKTAQRRHER
jgi:hypothetical protein